MEYFKRKEHDITVVFDGWKGGGSAENYSVRGGVRIIYSRLGEKADSVIKRIISAEKKEWIVISSDRDIAAHAWSTGSVPVPSETFMELIGKSVLQYQEADEIEDDEDYGIDTSRKGNPGRLSKKEKAIQRALSKL
jgi:predicted RNA-binding protein with PIN domain